MAIAHAVLVPLQKPGRSQNTIVPVFERYSVNYWSADLLLRRTEASFFSRGYIFEADFRLHFGKVRFFGNVIDIAAFLGYFALNGSIFGTGGFIGGFHA